MVIRNKGFRLRQAGSLMIELLAAMTLLLGTLLPIAYSIVSERRLARAYYQRAVAMEIVDGEMEVLRAGAWRSLTPGTHDFPVKADAAKNLPPGKFLVSLEEHNLRLEWRPAAKHHGGTVIRKVTLP